MAFLTFLTHVYLHSLNTFSKDVRLSWPQNMFLVAYFISPFPDFFSYLLNLFNMSDWVDLKIFFLYLTSSGLLRISILTLFQMMSDWVNLVHFLLPTFLALLRLSLLILFSWRMSSWTSTIFFLYSTSLAYMQIIPQYCDALLRIKFLTYRFSKGYQVELTS